ncbi:MAG TPA: hypothetical protein VKO85_01440, partial [Wenzhouxiangellaceae bacterium]|nr:hypothetical protein [Wenzhouxiangellaceae bacterium]
MRLTKGKEYMGMAARGKGLGLLVRWFAGSSFGVLVGWSFLEVPGDIGHRGGQSLPGVRNNQTTK